MEIAAFDTHEFIKRLTNAGMPEPQAEILAEEQSRLIKERLATKQDLKATEAALEQKLKELEAFIKAVEAGLKRDLKELEDRLIRDNMELKRDFKEVEDRLKRDIKEMEQKLTIKLGAMLAIGITVFAVLDKLL